MSHNPKRAIFCRGRGGMVKETIKTFQLFRKSVLIANNEFMVGRKSKHQLSLLQKNGTIALLENIFNRYCCSSQNRHESFKRIFAKLAAFTEPLHSVCCRVSSSNSV